MTFPRAGSTAYQHRDLLLDEAARSKVMDDGAIEIGQQIEVESFEGFLVSEVGAPQPHRQLLLIPPSDFVVNQQAEEIGVGQLAVDCFAVAGFERVEDAGQ